MAVACFLIPGFAAWARQRLASAWPQLGVYDGEQRITAASAALQEAGLATGESLARARMLFPKANFYPADPALESATWEEVEARLFGLTPRLWAWRPGWAFLEIDDPEPLHRLAATLGAQAGLASRRLWAALAALSTPAGTLRQLSDSAARRLFAETSCRSLAHFDVEEELIQRLQLFGLSTLGKVNKLTRRHLSAQFGARGEALYALLHPAQPEPRLPLFQPPPTVEVSCDFESPALEPAEVEPALLALLQRAVGELDERQAQRVTLRLEGRRGSRAGVARRVLRAPTARVSVLWTAARALLYSLLSGETPLERMTLELGGLSSPRVQQGRFTFTRPAVREALRGVQERFPGALRRARLASPHALFPEDQVAWEPYPLAVPDEWSPR